MTEPTTPTGTPRPNTLVDHAEARQQLADSQQVATPEAVEARTAVNRLGRLEERADRADNRLGTIEAKLDHNTKATSRGASWSQVAAIVTPVVMAILSALGEWGRQHPEAQVGIVGVVLALCGAFIKTKGAPQPGASPATVATTSAHAPPPEHT